MANSASFSGTTNSNDSSHVQLVQLTKTQLSQTGETILQIDVKAVNEVLGNPEYQDHYVAIYTIAGPSRSGKSFLLSLLYHYLKSSNEKNTYEQWSKNNKRLDKIFQWKKGARPCTEGINILKKPFVFCSEERKIALFLVDTEGIFGFNTSEKNQDILGIFSFMISSFVIFNVRSTVETNHFRAIYGFEKSLRGMNKEDFIMQTESLVFVVRDWCYDANEFDSSDDDDDCQMFEYGMEGGKKYFETVIEEDSGNRANEHKDMLKYFKYAFGENLRCCLLPDPGKAVKTGKVCSVLNLSDDFRRESFALFRKTAEKYKIKEIQKKICTCRELCDVINDFVALFTSQLDVSDRRSFIEKDIARKMSRNLRNCVHEFMNSTKKEEWNGKDAICEVRAKWEKLKLESKSKFKQEGRRHYPNRFLEVWEKELDRVLDQIIGILDACVIVEKEYKAAILKYNDWQTSITSSSLRAEVSEYEVQVREKRKFLWQEMEKNVSYHIRRKDISEDVLSQCKTFFFEHTNKLTANIDKDIQDFLAKMKYMRIAMTPITVLLGLGSYVIGKIGGANIPESPLQLGRNAMDGLFSERVKKRVEKTVFDFSRQQNNNSKLQLYKEGKVTMELSFGNLVFKLNVRDS